jgi:hypothetical protein
MKREPKQTNCEICDKSFLQYQMPRVCSHRCAAERKRRKEALKPAKLGLKPIYKIPKHSKADSLQSLENQAKAVFQKWVRLRDARKPCVSCGARIYIMHAGHYFKCEIYSGLIFNEINCNSQCDICNTLKDGNLKGYKDGLISKYGEIATIKLIQSADVNRNYKYTRNELIAKRLQYELKIKEMENKN